MLCAQFPNFHKLSIVSLLAAVMSISYSTIAIGVAGHAGKQPGVEYNLDGFTKAAGIFGVFNSLGTIAFAYGGQCVPLQLSFCAVLSKSTLKALTQHSSKKPAHLGCRASLRGSVKLYLVI